MAWSDLTLTRDDIDAFEKQSFKDLNVTTGNQVLGIDEDDNLVLDKAKQVLEADVVDQLQDLLNDSTYASETALLDAIQDADSRDLLTDLLTYKFLELWFYQDATHADSKSMGSAKKYYNMYVHYLRINLRRLAGALSSPKQVRRIQMKSTYSNFY